MPLVSQQQQRVSRVSEVRTRPASVAYEIAIEEDSVELYDEFIAAYPDDPLADNCRRLRNRP